MGVAMWVMLNNSFLSIVEPSSADPKAAGADVLLVRARIKGHIEAVFPNSDVLMVAGRDYQFRAYVDRQLVANAIAAKIAGIHYGNFKNSVKNETLHRGYACVWGVMAQLQEIPPYETKPRARRLAPVDPRHPYANDPQFRH